MKKHLSVFSLIARESMVKISLLWLLSAILQTAVFYRLMFSERVADFKFLSEAFSYYSDDLCISFVFALTLLLTGMLLMKTGMDFRTRTGYTLRRLRISEKQVFLIQSVYNCFMVLLLIIFEVVLCFFLANWGTTLLEPEYITNQTVYLTFYMTGFLQELFAGRSILVIIRNVLIVLSLGFNLSAFSYLWRRGRKYIFGVLVLTAASLFFWVGYGFEFVENIAIAVTVAGTLLIALGMVRSRREEYDS